MGSPNPTPTRAAHRTSSFVARRSASATLAALIALAAGAAARADPSTTDRAAAERLFERGRGQIERGEIAAACESFTESQRLDPGTGTLLNLASCHEAQDKLATAWVEFREALPAVRRERRPDRLRYALDHLAAIEPRLAYVTISVPGAAQGHAPVVSVDGRVLGPAAWGVAIPVDAGSHEARAEHGSGRVWRATIDIRDGERRQLEIPEPAPEPVIALAPPAARSDAAPEAAARDVSSRGPVTTVVAGAAGVAAIGVGLYFAWSASDLWRQRNQDCPLEACSPEGVRLGSRAQTAADVATWTIGGGAVLLGTAAVLWFVSRSSTHRSASGLASSSRARRLGGVHLTPWGPLGLGGTF